MHNHDCVSEFVLYMQVTPEEWRLIADCLVRIQIPGAPGIAAASVAVAQPVCTDIAVHTGCGTAIVPIAASPSAWAPINWGSLIDDKEEPAVSPGRN